MYILKAVVLCYVASRMMKFESDLIAFPYCIESTNLFQSEISGYHWYGALMFPGWNCTNVLLNFMRLELEALMPIKCVFVHKEMLFCSLACAVVCGLGTSIDWEFAMLKY